MALISNFHYGCVMRTDTTTEYSITFYALLKSLILRQKRGSYDVWFSFSIFFLTNLRNFLTISEICNLREKLPLTSDPTMIFGFSGTKCLWKDPQVGSRGVYGGSWRRYRAFHGEIDEKGPLFDIFSIFNFFFSTLSFSFWTFLGTNRKLRSWSLRSSNKIALPPCFQSAREA